MTSDAFCTFVEWVIGDFFPFGDLVSDFWLLLTLPLKKTDEFDTSAQLYERMWMLMACGTMVDAIPEVALILAITTGIVVITVLGPIYVVTGYFKKEVTEIASGVWQLMRCADHSTIPTNDSSRLSLDSIEVGLVARRGKRNEPF